MIELIPAIDIIDGQCVRLTKGDYDQKTVYRDSPAEVAKEFEQLGFRRDTAEYWTVHDVLGFGAVEIHHVQSPESDMLKLQGHVQRLAVDCLLVVIALRQSHALSVDNIDSWY